MQRPTYGEMRKNPAWVELCRAYRDPFVLSLRPNSGQASARLRTGLDGARDGPGH